MSLVRRAGTVGALTVVSRALGFVRDAIMAAILGTGPVADAFMVAFRLPNHFRAILAEGAFNSAFLPTYSAASVTGGEQTARALRSDILSWLLFANLAILAFALIATGWLVTLLAGGLSADASQRDLAIDLTRITFPYLACMSIVSLMAAVLNAHDKFAVAASAPVLLNLSMAGLLMAAWMFPSAAHAAAWGVLVGGIAQLALMIAACLRSNLGFSIGLPRFTPEVRTFFRRLGPAVLGAGGVQIAMFADTAIATYLPSGSLSYLYYADRLYQLPLAVFGIAIGTALLPDLSRRLADPADTTAPTTLGHAVAFALVLALPCTLCFLLAGDLIIQVLFARGAFADDAVTGAAGALVAYSFGLPPAIALRGLVSGFHARGDTATPVKALAVATVVNVGLKFALVGTLAHVGLASATAFGIWIYAGILAAILHRRRRLTFSSRSRSSILAAAVACVPAAAAVHGLRHSIDLSDALPVVWRDPATLAAVLVVITVSFCAALLLAAAFHRNRE